MELLNSDEDILNTIHLRDVCLCCLTRNVKFVSLSKCKHTSFFGYFIKYKWFFQIPYEDLVICYECHHFLNKIDAFKKQVQDTLKFVWKNQTCIGLQREKYLYLTISPTKVTSNLEDINIDEYEQKNETIANSKQAQYDDLTAILPDTNPQQPQYVMTADVKIEEGTDVESDSAMTAENDRLRDSSSQERDLNNTCLEHRKSDVPRLRSTAKQMAALLKFIESHPELALSPPKMCTPQQRKQLDQLWAELAETVNGVNSGHKKSQDKWKKVWADWKHKVLKKVQQIRRQGSPRATTLKSVEQRVWALIADSKDGGVWEGMDTTPALDSIPENFQTVPIENVDVKNEPTFETKTTPNADPLHTQCNSLTTVKIEATEDFETDVAEELTAVDEVANSEQAHYMSNVKFEEKEVDCRMTLMERRNKNINVTDQLPEYDLMDIEYPEKRSEPRVRSTGQHLTTMLEFMEKHRDFALGRLKPGLHDADVLWAELTDLMNSVGDGRRKKSQDKWKKAWTDWKSKTRRKAQTSPETRATLTRLERRLWDLLSDGLDDAVGKEWDAIVKERDSTGTELDTMGTERIATGTERIATGTERLAVGTEQATGTENGAMGTKQVATGMERDASGIILIAARTEHGATGAERIATRIDQDSPGIIYVPARNDRDVNDGSDMATQSGSTESDSSDDETSRHKRHVARMPNVIYTDTRPRCSSLQLNTMMEFMERHGDPTTWKHITKASRERRWDKLVDRLNAMDDTQGQKKTVEKWKKVWTHLKFKSTKKVRLNRERDTPVPLSPLETRAWAVVSRSRRATKDVDS